MAKTSRRKRTRMRKAKSTRRKRLSRREVHQLADRVAGRISEALSDVGGIIIPSLEGLMTPEPGYDYVSIVFGDAANTMFSYSPTEKVLGGPATTANQFARLLTTACRRYGAPIGKVSHSRIHGAEPQVTTDIVGFGEWAGKPKEIEAIFTEYLRRTGCTSVQKIKMSETKQ